VAARGKTRKNCKKQTEILNNGQIAVTDASEIFNTKIRFPALCTFSTFEKILDSEKSAENPGVG